MIVEIQNNMDQIAEACNKHRVKTLFLFGSAARQHDFSIESDIDFLVEFAYSYQMFTNDEIVQHIQNKDLLKAALEDITKREVDLVQEDNIQNKFLKYFINKDKKLIYAVS